MRELRRCRLQVVAFVGIPAALFLLTGPACGGAEPEPTAATTENTASNSSGESAERQLPPGMSAVEMQALLEEGNEFIRTVLDDWQVTPSEYEAAVLQVLECLDAEGVPYSEPRLFDTLDGPRWMYSVGPSSDEQAAEHGRIHDECDRDYLRPVLSVWARQEQPSEAERRRQDEEFVACLSRAGIAVSSREEAELLRSEGQLSGEEQLAFVMCLTGNG